MLWYIWVPLTLYSCVVMYDYALSLFGQYFCVAWLLQVHMVNLFTVCADTYWPHEELLKHMENLILPNEPTFFCPMRICILWVGHMQWMIDAPTMWCVFMGLQWNQAKPLVISLCLSHHPASWVIDLWREIIHCPAFSFIIITYITVHCVSHCSYSFPLFI